MKELCTRCHKHPQGRGYQRCDECREYSRVNEQYRQQRKEEDQECLRCRRPVEEGFRYCRKHAIAIRERSRKRSKCRRRSYGAKSYDLERGGLVEAFRNKKARTHIGRDDSVETKSD